MLCPVCRVDLVMADRQGVEIDYCPKCRGIWLDRGEIDKIVERSLALEVPRAARYPDPPPQQGYPAAQGRPAGGHDGSHTSSGHGKHRLRSWLRDLFD